MSEKLHDNPAWVRYQADALTTMLESQGYGADDAPDLFITNFKPSDITAHQYSMDSPEMGDILEAQDEALGRLVEYLDAEVQDYVIVVTADHGNTPPARPHRCVAGPAGTIAGGHRCAIRRSKGQVPGRPDHRRGAVPGSKDHEATRRHR